MRVSPTVWMSCWIRGDRRSDGNQSSNCSKSNIDIVSRGITSWYFTLVHLAADCCASLRNACVDWGLLIVSAENQLPQCRCKEQIPQRFTPWLTKNFLKLKAALFNFCVRTCQVKSFHNYKTLCICQQLLVVTALLRFEWITMITINAVPQINVTNVFAIFKISTSLNLTYKKYLFNWFFSLQWK